MTRRQRIRLPGRLVDALSALFGAAAILGFSFLAYVVWS